MAESADYRNFKSQYGVIYLPYLRDGDGFTGRAKRAAREIALEQDELDEALFAANGGFEKVRRRLLAKWDDDTQSLSRLTLAEDRLLLMLSLDDARLGPVEVVYVDQMIGNGLIASGRLRANEFIGEYTGVLRLPRDGDDDNRYLAGTKAYGDCEDFLIDGQDEGNLTRFINHSFTAPNVRSEHVFHNQRWHRVLRADRDIEAGEALLWNYGDDYWRSREIPAEL